MPTLKQIRRAHDVIDIVLFEAPLRWSERDRQTLLLCRSLIGWVFDCECGEGWVKMQARLEAHILETGGRIVERTSNA